MSIEIAQLGKMRGKSRENRKKVSRETKKRRRADWEEFFTNVSRET